MMSVWGWTVRHKNYVVEDFITDGQCEKLKQNLLVLRIKSRSGRITV